MKTGTFSKLALASLALTASLLSSAPAFADWGHRGGGGWDGPHVGISLGGYGYNPYYGGYAGYPAYGYPAYGYPAYYAPPPTVVYETPPQVAYVQAPPVAVAPPQQQIVPAPNQAPPNSAYPGYFGQ